MPPLRPASETVIPLRPSSGSRRPTVFSPLSALVPPPVNAARQPGGPLPLRRLSVFAAVLLLGVGSFLSLGLALLDQLADLVADLLVEGRAALGLDGLAALLADLLVEARPPLRLDGVPALLADLLVELA